MTDVVLCPHCGADVEVRRWTEHEECTECGWLFLWSYGDEGEPVAWREWDERPEGT